MEGRDHGFGDRDGEANVLVAMDTRARQYSGGGGEHRAHQYDNQRGGNSAPPKPPRQGHGQQPDFSGRKKYQGPRSERYCIERTERVCPVGTIKDPGICPKGWSHKPELFPPALARKRKFKEKFHKEWSHALKHERDLIEAGMISDTGRKPRA